MLFYNKQYVYGRVEGTITVVEAAPVHNYPSMLHIKLIFDTNWEDLMIYDVLCAVVFVEPYSIVGNGMWISAH